MRQFILRVIINAVAVAITAKLLPGFHVASDSLWTLLIIGLIFGLVNAFIRPLLTLLTCPLVMVTLGLFILVINGVLLQITAWIAGDRLKIDNFGWAILGGIIMAVVGLILEVLLGVRGDGGRRRKQENPIEYRRLR
jgi:putative membrane protein